MGISYAPLPPEAFEKAIVFIDGTNLFCRLQAAKLKVKGLKEIIRGYVGRREILRTYLYTVEQHLQRAKQIHNPDFLEAIRVVLGEGVPKKDGNIKEKGVDALLVADLIYHAANKNCQYALLVSVDTDFVYALRRAEDFGCRTAVLAICAEAPLRLREACDHCSELTADDILKNQWGVHA
jgi:uncharacterized LabA/DUF88 family protein